ncbi:mitochondrial fission ELM1 family protein [Craurococcus roseus]|uniref:Mitochondrial fission ELM1 family protein n=1 Tax=Craurococcus roseus TaxID=77585 RepID=A0ABP3QVT8_9PROT
MTADGGDAPVRAPVWVLADPRAGTAAQALGIAERLGVPFRALPLEWGAPAALPLAWPSLLGLAPKARDAVRGGPPWPRLAISAGRRSAPVSLWLARRGVRTVHCMRPAFGRRRFDLLVLGRHDAAPEAHNILSILGATHQISPARLAAARAEWNAALATMPRPRVALLVGGKVRAAGGMEPAIAAGIGARASGVAGSVLATTSRRTGGAAADALAEALRPVPHRLFRWGDAGPNPYLGFLAWADAVVATGDSVSMLSEALATAAPVFVADPGGLGARHLALHASLYAAGQARPVDSGLSFFSRTPLDESGRVAAEIRARGLL